MGSGTTKEMGAAAGKNSSAKARHHHNQQATAAVATETAQVTSEEVEELSELLSTVRAFVPEQAASASEMTNPTQREVAKMIEEKQQAWKLPLTAEACDLLFEPFAKRYVPKCVLISLSPQFFDSTFLDCMTILLFFLTNWHHEPEQQQHRHPPAQEQEQEEEKVPHCLRLRMLEEALNANVLNRLMHCLQKAVLADTLAVSKVQLLLWTVYQQHAEMRACLRGLLERELQGLAKKGSCGAAEIGNSGNAAGSQQQQQQQVPLPGTNFLLGGSENTEDFFIVDALLHSITPLCKGFKSPLSNVRLDEVVFKTLLPLFFRDEDSVAMNCGERIASLIHVLLLKVPIEQVGDVTVRVFKAMTDAWKPALPMRCCGILRGLSSLVEELDGDSFETLHGALLQILAEAGASEHKQLALLALTLIQQDNFMELLVASTLREEEREHDEQEREERREAEESAAVGSNAPTSSSSSPLVALSHALMRNGEVHWDGGVVVEIVKSINKVESLVCHDFKKKYCLTLFGGSKTRLDAYLQQLNARYDKITTEEEGNRAEMVKRQRLSTQIQISSRVKSHLQLIFGKDLGKGAYSSVKYVKCIEREVAQRLWLTFAVKEVSKSLLKEQQCEEQFAREVEILQQLKDQFREQRQQHHRHRSSSSNWEGKKNEEGGEEGDDDYDDDDAWVWHAMMFGHFEDKTKHYILMEYCEKGDLFSALESLKFSARSYTSTATASSSSSPGHLANAASTTLYRNMQWVKFVLLEVAHALNGIHAAGYYYGDLKIENVLISSANHMKLCDFGSAIPLDKMQEQPSFAGTLEHMSPELVRRCCSAAAAAKRKKKKMPSHHRLHAEQEKLEGEEHDEECAEEEEEEEEQREALDGRAADWWAYGCLAVQLITFALPFEDPTGPDALMHELCALTDECVLQRVQELYTACAWGRLMGDMDAPRFIVQLLMVDPAARAGFDAVRSDPFFSGVRVYGECTRGSGFPPDPPPKVHIPAAVKQSSRKQSMMWQLHKVNRAAQQLTSGAANLVLEEEPSGSVQIDPTRPKAKKVKASGGGGDGGDVGVVGQVPDFASSGNENEDDDEYDADAKINQILYGTSGRPPRSDNATTINTPFAHQQQSQQPQYLTARQAALARSRGSNGTATGGSGVGYALNSMAGRGSRGGSSGRNNNSSSSSSSNNASLNEYMTVMPRSRN